MDLTPSYLTPAMEEVIAIRAKRLASGNYLKSVHISCIVEKYEHNI
jgi:hypothetical protein